MTQKKPVVFLTRKLPDSTETRMRELFDTRLNETDLPMSDAELRDVVKQADVLVPTVTDRIDADLIAAAGDQLKLIASFGTGVDHIDLAAARARGITVTNTPGVLTEDTADVALALMLAVPRRIAEGDKVARAGDWNGWSPTGMLGHRINGKRLGIIGMGRIGSAVARRARGFGLSIHYHNRKPVHPETEAELEATYWESLDQMLSRVDIVSVNCPHTPATHRMLSRERLELMQPSAYLVNTSRGEVVDEEALPTFSRSAISPAPGSTSMPTSPTSRRRSWRFRTWCCCRTSAPRPSRAGSKWATRSSSISRHSGTVTHRGAG